MGEISAKRGSGMCQRTFDTGVAPVLRQELAHIPLGTTGHDARTDKHQLGRGAARVRRSATMQRTYCLVLPLANTHSA